MVRSGSATDRLYLDGVKRTERRKWVQLAAEKRQSELTRSVGNGNVMSSVSKKITGKSPDNVGLASGGNESVSNDLNSRGKGGCLGLYERGRAQQKRQADRVEKTINDGNRRMKPKLNKKSLDLASKMDEDSMTRLTKKVIAFLCCC